MSVPKSITNWFIFHFFVDMVFAFPLFFWPKETLEYLNWPYWDPFMARLVAAALFAIGITSFFHRYAKREVYLALLNLKIIWSGFAIAGILLSAQMVGGMNVNGWLISAIFLCFFLVWSHYKKKLIGM